MSPCIFVIESTGTQPIRVEYTPKGETPLTLEQLKTIHYMANLAYKMFVDPFIQTAKTKYNICDLNMMSFLIFNIFHIKYDHSLEPPKEMYDIWNKIKNERYYKHFFKHFLGIYIHSLHQCKPYYYKQNVKKFFDKYKKLTGNDFVYKVR